MANQQRQTSDWQEADISQDLQPFTQHKSLREDKAIIFTRGEGCFVWDSDGNKYLEGMSGLACVNIGYGRKELADVAAKQINTLSFSHSYYKSSNKPAIRLAEKLVEITPTGLNHVFYANSGSEAHDTAIRMVRTFWMLEGRPEKRVIISREMAYHGSTVAAGALSGIPEMHKQAAVIDGIEHIKCPDKFIYGRGISDGEFGRLAAGWLEGKIEELGADKVAAFIAEPIQGAGGGKFPPDNYFAEINRICKKYDVLLIIDEVMTGFGRTGNWFASKTFNIRDIDLMCIAKGITSGYIPLSACMMNDRVANSLIEKGGEFYHGFTNSGHPVACAVALENIRIIEAERLIEKVAGETGPYLAGKLAGIANHPVIGEVRVSGMFGAVELVKDNKRWNLSRKTLASLSARANSSVILA